MSGRDPALYDAMMALRGRSWDIAWYLSLARSVGGSVLELGAGTGRILLPLLEAGLDAYGLEFDRQMLGHGKAKIAARFGDAAAARLTQGDMRRFRHDRTYDLVMVTYNSFCLLHDRDELDRTLSSVERHLVPGGALAFDIILADALPWAVPPHRWSSEGQATLPGAIVVRFAEEGTYDPAARTHLIRQHFQWPDGLEREEILTLHQWRAGDLEDALASRGWKPAAGLAEAPTSGAHAWSAVWRRA